ncbi:hypothetical protein F5Y05DRAFT_410484 [Hypoxylon sp. FL0543]|nr:hypothetical protein F5Y05DRAFT_410484 [Hypoxylon sp. FL0543]
MRPKRPADWEPATTARPKAQKKQKTTATTAALPSAAPQPDGAELDRNVVRDKAYALRNLVYRQIKRQMKWTPSCRTGRARWSYNGGVANAAIFLRAFRLEATNEKGKKWKQKKIPIDEFESCIGEVTASIRWGSLRMMGPHVNLKWDEEDNMFTVSGKYGLSQLRWLTDEADEDAE